jgi:hypothetical protein
LTGYVHGLTAHTSDKEWYGPTLTNTSASAAASRTEMNDPAYPAAWVAGDERSGEPNLAAVPRDSQLRFLHAEISHLHGNSCDRIILKIKSLSPKIILEDSQPFLVSSFLTTK